MSALRFLLAGWVLVAIILGPAIGRVLARASSIYPEQDWEGGGKDGAGGAVGADQ